MTLHRNRALAAIADAAAGVVRRLVGGPRRSRQGCGRPMESLEARQLLSTVNLAAGVLTFTSTPGNNNTLHLIYDGNTNVYVMQELSTGADADPFVDPGQAGVAVPPGGGVVVVNAALVNAIVINSGDGNDNITIVNNANDTVTINAGDGDDVITLGGAGSLQNIQSTFTINTGGGANTINLDDSAAAANNVTLTLNSIAGLAPATLNYSTTGTVTLNISGSTAGGDTYTIASTLGAGNVLNLTDGGGANTFNIQAVDTGVAATFTGGTGADTFNLGTANDLTTLLAPITIAGGGGNDTINANDSARAAGGVYTLTATNLDVDGGVVSVNFTSIEVFNLTGQTGDDTFDLNGFSANTAYTVDGDAGDDTYNIAAAQLPGTSSLVLNDAADTGIGQPVTLDAGNNQFDIHIQDAATPNYSYAAQGGGLVTVNVINSVQTYINATGIGVFITLDAGDGTPDVVTITDADPNITFDLPLAGQLTYPKAEITGMGVTGNTDDNTLILDFGGQGTLVPINGIIYAGGVGVDDLVLQNGTVTSETYTPTNGTDGKIAIDGNLITYTGLNPIVDTLVATDFTLGTLGGTVNITDGAAADAWLVSSPTLAFEQVEFSNKTNVIIIDTGNAPNIFNLTTLTNTIAGLQTLTINGAGGADTINLTVALLSDVGVTAVNLNGGADNDKFNVAAGDLIIVTYALTVDGGAGTDTLVIDDSLPGIGFYTIDATQILTNFLGPGGSLNYLDTNITLAIADSVGGNPVNVDALAAGTALIINAPDNTADTYNIDIAGIPADASVTINTGSRSLYNIDNGGAGNTKLTVNDTASPTFTWTVGGNNLVTANITAAGYDIVATNVPAGGLTTVVTLTAAGTSTVAGSATTTTITTSRTNTITFPVDAPAQTTLTGSALADDFVVNFGGGAFNPIAGGLTLTGGGGLNRLFLENGTGTTETYTLSDLSNTAGTVVIDSAGPLSFTGIALVTDILNSTTTTINLPTGIGALQVNVVDGPVYSGVQTGQVDDNATNRFVTINYGNKVNTNVNAGPAADTINFNMFTSPTGHAALVVDGGNGNDTFNVGVVGTGLNVSLLGGNGDDTFNITLGLTGILGSLHIDGNAPTVPATPGDTINLIAVGIVDIYTDPVLGAPNTRVGDASGNTLDYINIETFNLTANTVRFLGDRGNNPGTDEDDVFTVIGTAPNEADIRVNSVLADGATIHVTGLFHVQAFGFEGNDTFNVQPYADNLPTGWGVDVTFAGGANTGRDQLTYVPVNGVADAVTVTPGIVAGAGQVAVRNGASSTPIVIINFTTTENVLISGDSGASGDTDTLIVNGTGGDDKLSFTGSTVVFTNQVAVDSNLPIVVNALGGNDIITLQDTLVPFVINAGPGNDTITLINVGADVVVFGDDGHDTIDASLAARGVTLHGGTGNDTITGSALADYITGGDGNDLLTGGAGDDYIDGGAGNDIVTGGAGNDTLLGGADSDTFTWNPGDGSDVVEGGGGVDRAIFNGAAAAEAFALTAVGGRLLLTRSVGAISMDFGGITQLDINALGGADTFTVGDLSGTGLAVLNIDVGAGDGAADSVSLNGSAGADVIGVDGTTGLTISGLAAVVNITGTTTDDLLSIFAGAGNDTVTATAGAEALVSILLDGGDGHDYLQADATLIGGAGNDTLIGGAGDDSLDGGDGDDWLSAGEGNNTLVGGAGNDTLIGGSGDDTYDAGAGDDLILDGGGTNTIDGGAGLDTLRIDGTPGADVISVTQASATSLNWSVNAVTSTNTIVSGSLEFIPVNAGAGADTITVLAGGIAITVDAGDGNDIVSAAGSTSGVTLLGGAGDDSLTGGSAADSLDGGAGDDTLIGGPGNDSMSGGAGNDTLIWNNGDNSDIMDGGTGSDIVIVNGAAAGDAFTIAANGSHVAFARTNLVPFTLDIASVEQLDVNSGAGADSFAVSSLAGTGLAVLNLNAGAADGAADTFTFTGTVGPDNIALGLSGTALSLTGLGPVISLTNTTAADAVTLFGGDGNDTIKAADGVEAILSLTLDGGAGDDYLSADATLLGGPGNDTLIGGAGDDSLDGGDGDDWLEGRGGNDTLRGGAGNDTLIGGAGTDLLDGGTGYDTVLVTGTSGDDTLDLSQPAGGTLTVVLNSVTDTDTLVAGTIENIQVTAGAGDDVITVTQADGLGAASIQFTIDGGSATTRDRLVVNDAGTADLTIYRRGATPASGTITVGSLAQVIFTDVELAQPVPAAGGQVAVIDYDRNEYNDDLFNATNLGSGATLTIGAAIDPPASGAAPADVDLYRFRPALSGLLDLQLVFTQVSGVGSRPGLPGNGDLALALLDATGAVIALSDGATSGERILAPIVAEQVYFIRVTGSSTAAVNSYSLNVNSALAPASVSVQINPADDTGYLDTDNITFRTLPVLVVHADLTGFADRGLAILTPAQANGGVTAGAAIEVFNNGVSRGFATVVAQTNNTLFTYTFTAGQLAEGENQITAAVRIFDGATATATDRVALSAPLTLTLDTVAPPAPTPPAMLLSSDAALQGDNITNITSPAFQGSAEANSLIRLYATDANGVTQLVGQARAGSDASDGILGNGLGHWEITVEPLRYGYYSITATAEDAAGNISAVSGGAGGGVDILVSSFDLRLSAANSYPSLSSPMAVVTGDLNGDGRIDMVSVDHSGNISTYLNRGKNLFRRAMRTSVRASGPTDLALADVNGDGILDVVTTNFGSSNVSVLIGNGDATFKAPRLFKTFRNPTALRLGDVNGDGKNDVVILHRQTHKISVLRNITPAGGSPVKFGKFKTVVIPGISPVAMDMADLNGDGRPDLVVVNETRSRSADILLGRANGGFRKIQRLRVGLPATSVVIADVNNDGILDFAASTESGEFVSVALGKGGAIFNARTRVSYFGDGATARAIAAADLNQDGWTDLITANQTGSNLGVMLGNGNGSFQNQITFPMGRMEPGQPHAIAIDDFNGDGLPDLAVANAGTNDIAVFYNSQVR